MSVERVELCIFDCLSALLKARCFSRQQMFEFDEQLAKKDDDVFHFVAYVEVKGRLYELDGLKEGPVDLGKCDEGDWLKTVKPVLDQRIQRFAVTASLSSYLLTFSLFPSLPLVYIPSSLCVFPTSVYVHL